MLNFKKIVSLSVSLIFIFSQFIDGEKLANSKVSSVLLPDFGTYYNYKIV